VKANLTLFFFAVFLLATVAGWDWPYIAKLMPVYVAALPGLILSAIQIYRDATGWDSRSAAAGPEMDEVYEAKLDRKTESRRTLVFFAWLIGGALAIWLLGIVISLPLLILLYMLVEGREKWWTSIAMAASTYLLVWGLFEYLLDTRWPAGILLR
jgi:hypothetical protein